MGARSIVLALALSQSGCYLAHERDAVASSCDVPSATEPCAAWRAAGPAVLVSRVADISGAVQLQAAAATSCGVVVAWISLTGRPLPETRDFETRALGWDGMPLGAVGTHAALTASPSTWGRLELVPAPGALDALVASDRTGCSVVRFDERGQDVSAPVRVVDAYCHDLDHAGTSLSFLTSDDAGRTPGTLVTVDPGGRVAASVALAMPGGRSLWSRTTLPDGSFVLYSFSEDFVTAVYSGFLQHFDAGGTALAPEVELGFNGVPVLIAPTERGAVSAWETSASGGLPLQVRAVDRDARPLGAARDLPAEGALYGAMLTPSPDGNVLAVWLESHFDEDPAWRLRAQVLGPDAAPLAEPTLLATDVGTTVARVVVERTGERALAVYDHEGVFALPLVCDR